MRRQYLPLMALFAAGFSAPASAQVVTPVTPPRVASEIVFVSATPARPDLVVARLMSFDRNADGRIAIDELPERMQSVLVRGDRSNDGALDREEIRQLAVSPARNTAVQNGHQSGGWAFGGGFDFDTSKRIDDGLEDLRLAADTREKAREIVRKFVANADANASENMWAVLSRVLTREQLEDFRTVDGAKTVSVPAVVRNGVTFFGATPEEAAGQERVTVRLRLVPPGDPEVRLEKYALSAAAKTEAVTAIRLSRARTPGRLSEAEIPALLEQFRGLLTDEQRDDLRASLGRRPVVQVARVSPPLPPPPPVRPSEPAGTVQALTIAVAP